VPITTTTQIIISLTGQADEPEALSPYLMVNRAIRLWELPPAESCAFALRVSEGDHTGEFQLSATESEQLTTLLAQLPTHSMDSEGVSFDGVSYELIIMQAELSLFFRWRNNDWQYTQSPLDKWERVAALADYVLNLAKKA
jgi:hypothetical protein